MCAEMMHLRLIVLSLTVCILAQTRVWAESSDRRHALFTAVLHDYVYEGRVDYGGFGRDERFSSYLRFLASTDPDTIPAPRDRLAFWINAYNAYTIKLIIDRMPISSIRDISLGLPILFGPWSIDIAAVGGVAYSLNHIEHGVIREEFEEPRIHFALVCAARSCPDLRPEAYEGYLLERQLEEETRRFLADTTKNRFHLKHKTLYLSRIFDWYEGDFEETAGSLPAFLLPYLEQEWGVLFKSGDFRVEFLDYDWSLNAAESGAEGDRRSP